MLRPRSFNRFILISLALLGLSVSSANAALTNSDWLAGGDNLLTNDDNGLQWLDLSQTRGLSYNTVSAQLGAGGTYAGFRYATKADVEGLWDTAGGDDNHYDGWSTQNNGVFDILAPFWGDTFCQTNSCTVGDGYSWALLGDAAGSTSRRAALSYDQVLDSRTGGEDYLFAYDATFRDDQSLSNVGSALVRDAPSAVPVPAAVWLFGTALVGLIGFGRRKSRIAP